MLEVTRRGAQDPISALGLIRHARADMDHMAGLWAEAAHAEGYTWGQIGRALGVSRQAARQAHLARAERGRRIAEEAAWFPLGKITRPQPVSVKVRSLPPAPATRRRWWNRRRQHKAAA